MHPDVDFRQLRTRRHKIASLDELKSYRVVSKMLNEFHVRLGTGIHTDPDVMFVVAVEDVDQSVWLVCTERGFDTHPDKIQNIRMMLTAQHGYSRVNDAIAPPHVIFDYIKSEVKNAKNRSSDKSDEDAQKYSVALQELESLVTDACKVGANDIHIEVSEEEAKIQYRIDGRLVKTPRRGRDSIRPMVAAALNARSGDFTSTFNENEVNANTVDVPTIMYVDPKTGKNVRRNLRLRIQKTPQHGGFRVTARIQDTNSEDRMTREKLGLEPDVDSILERSFSLPDGIVIFTGPVGQGKTSTLVAMNEIPVSQKKKIISLEDPIEIIQPEIQQTLCKPDDPVLNFPNMIKVALREDMDVLEVSEIRDLQTASAAIRASITGHLVISTLHANTALGAIPRLIDLGISARSLATPGVLRTLTGQRLIPKLCPSCKVREDASFHKIPSSYNFTGQYIYRTSSNGCENCGGTGEIGRVLILEAIVIDQAAREFISEENLQGWAKHLNTMGFKTMAHRAWNRVAEGLIDPYLASQKIPDMWGTDEESFDYNVVSELSAQTVVA